MAYSLDNDQMHPQDRIVEEMKTANILKAIEILLTFYRNDKRLIRSWTGDDLRCYLVQVTEGKTISADGLLTCMVDRKEIEEKLHEVIAECKAAKKARC